MGFDGDKLFFELPFEHAVKFTSDFWGGDLLDSFYKLMNLMGGDVTVL